MKENLIIAIDFAEKVKKINGVLQIVLFGSVSRGEDTLRSDVDIAVIFDGIGREELAKEIDKAMKPDYTTKTEFIREAIREKVIKLEKQELMEESLQKNYEAQIIFQK